MNPIIWQLQFLPLAYAHSEEKIFVTDLPLEKSSPSLVLEENIPPEQKIITWGASSLIKKWADAHGHFYEIPPWEIVQRVNSKQYSFEKSPLPGATLLFNNDPIPPKCILKSCFGTAGKGSLFSDSPKAETFCKIQWNKGLPVLAEPWLDKLFDFSTQWSISPQKKITYLGVTFLTTGPSGTHIGNRVGDTLIEKKREQEINTQKKKAREVLKEMAELGYFGEVGFDAMVYLDNDQPRLHPIVEINARKTMGWVALEHKRLHFPGACLELSYTSSQVEGLLPLRLQDKQFSRQLTCKVK